MSASRKLELPNRVVNHNGLLNNSPRKRNKNLVNGVRLDVVIPVFRGLELDTKGMGNPILRIRQRFRSVPKGRLIPTWAPSGEWSLPPVNERMYGFWEVGCRQVSLRAIILAQAWVLD